MGKIFKTPTSLIIAIWAVFVVQQLIPAITSLGTVPRTLSGLSGLLCSPFLHGDINHIISNSIPLFILSSVLFAFYNKIALRVIIYSCFIGGSMVWLFARSANHIGASGLIYSLGGFLMAVGYFHRDLKSILITIVIFVMYGGMIWGVFPTKTWISWEGHLFGFIAGIILARVFKDHEES